MTLTIIESCIFSDMTDHQAAKVTREDVWSCTWLPGRRLSYNEAITAVTLAEFVDSGWAEGSKNWPIVRDFARELGMTAQEAAGKVLKTPAEGTARSAPEEEK